MGRLETLGCRAYQILEAPKVLELSEDDIYQRVDTLHQNLLTQISIPTISLASTTNTYHLKKSYVRYIQRTGGFDSVADVWRDVLGCTMGQMADLLLANPRLLSLVKHTQQRVEKACYLFDQGVSKDQLRTNSLLLVTVPLEVIKHRVEEVQALDIHPLPLSRLAQADYHYKRSLGKLREIKDTANQRWQVLEGLLGVPKEVLEKKHPVFANTSLKKLEERLQYLLNERGYSAEDVVNCPTILHKIEVSRLISAFTELEDEAGLEEVTLPTLLSFVNYHKLPAWRNGTQRSLRRALGTEQAEVAEVLPRDYAGLFQQRPSVIKENFAFLRTNNFERAVILDLPVVLGHSHQVLVRHWNDLPKAQSEHFDKWKNDPRKLLNLLQYDIEQSANFKHRVLTADHSSGQL